MKGSMIVFAAVVLLLLAVGAARSAGREMEPDQVRGEVVGVHPAVTAPDGTAWDEVTVRDRQGRNYRLRLQRSGDGPALCSLGQRVRARVMSGGVRDGAYLTSRIMNYSQGTDLQLRDSSGAPIPVAERIRLRQRDGSGEGDPDRHQARRRIHEPGSGGCAGGGSGRAGTGRGRR